MTNSYATLKAVQEAVKEALRYLLLGTLAEGGTLVVQILIAGVNTQTGVIAINWSVVEAVALFAFLTTVGRAVDKFKFIYNKETGLVNPETMVAETPKGVIPF